MKINAIIIDDEPRGRSTLSKLLALYCPEITVVAYAGSAQEGIAVIRQFQPDVVFLDIEMPNASGFDLLQAVSPFQFDVIFTTAHSQYALEAFRYGALDYLLKPIDPDELEVAAQRLLTKYKGRGQKEPLLKSPPQKTPQIGSKIVISTQNSIAFISLDDIVYCQSDSNYTTFYLTNNEKLMVSRTIKDYEEMLDRHLFFRIHQQFLVHLIHVKKILKQDGGYALMTNGAELEISRRKKDSFKEALERLYTLD